MKLITIALVLTLLAATSCKSVERHKYQQPKTS